MCDRFAGTVTVDSRVGTRDKDVTFPANVACADWPPRHAGSVSAAATVVATAAAVVVAAAVAAAAAEDEQDQDDAAASAVITEEIHTLTSFRLHYILLRKEKCVNPITR